MTILRHFTIAALALCLTACGKPVAHAADDPAFGEKVQAYLMAHPEVVEQAIGKLQQQKQAQAEQTAIAKIRSHKAALERDPRDFVVNPTGKITVVEFFDYQCGYCKLAAPEVVGRYAAERALSRLHARKIRTVSCPVLFESPLPPGC
jgi:protein-disulfide isomerase